MKSLSPSECRDPIKNCSAYEDEPPRKRSGPPKLTLIQTSEGWGLDASDFTPDVPIWAGDLTKREAMEMRRSFRRNGAWKGNNV